MRIWLTGKLEAAVTTADVIGDPEKRTSGRRRIGQEPRIGSNWP
jgi:hypothetical protein